MDTKSKILLEAFKRISTSVYDFLDVFPEIRQVNEDGISSIILKSIARLKGKGIYVHTQSLKINEDKTGMDFDLWIGQDNKRYVRFIVQSKSFRNQCHTTDSYDIDKTQCSKIIAHSKKEHKAFPLYFLYQHIEEPNLKANHFSFLTDFKDEYSSITFTSAYNIQSLLNKGNPTFAEVHKNDLKENWKNNTYEILGNNSSQIGLPLYVMHDISPSKIDEFLKLANDKNNSLGFFFFFFFFFGENETIKIHEMSSSDILETYGENDPDSEIQFKNLIIINDNNRKMRDRIVKLKNVLK